MGSMFSSPPSPPPIPVPPPAANPATSASSNVVASGANAKARMAAGAAQAGMNPTGPAGLEAPKTAKTTLLGD